MLFHYILKKMSIGKRLVLIFGLLITVPMIIVGTVSYQTYSSNLEDNTIKRMMELNESLILEINSIRKSNEEFSDKVLSQGTLQAVLSKKYTAAESAVEVEDKAHVEQILFSLTNPLNEANIFIVGSNGRTYRSNGDMARFNVANIVETSIFQRALESNGENIWVPTNEDIFHYLSGESFLYLVRRINSLSLTTLEIGHSIIQIKYTHLANVFQRLSFEEGEYIKVIDSNGMIFYDNQDIRLIGTQIEENILSNIGNLNEGVFFLEQEKVNYLVSYKMNQENGWSIIRGVPYSTIVAASKELRNFTLLVLSICLLIAVLVAVLFSRSIVQPIKNLKDSMVSLGDGNLEIKVDLDRQDEIGSLQRSFNLMVKDLHMLMAKTEEDQKRKQMLELQKLEYQINPHFLYNTLDRIHWMLQKNGQSENGEMITTLARYFRLGLSKGKETYSIKDELEHIQHYLYLMNNRSQEKIRIVIQADEDILHFKTPKILLQPLVENAIIHGFQENSDTNEIRITVTKDEDNIVYQVSDNGIGIATNQLQQIRKQISLDQPEQESRQGIGLSNTHQRIKLTYGSMYGLDIDSILEEGTVVTICIPQIP